MRACLNIWNALADGVAAVLGGQVLHRVAAAMNNSITPRHSTAGSPGVWPSVVIGVQLEAPILHQIRGRERCRGRRWRAHNRR